MGLKISKAHCFDLRDLPPDVLKAITSERYSVIRTSGEIDTGWIISTEQMCIPGIVQGYDGWEDAAATNFYRDREGNKGMKFFMYNGAPGESESKHRPHLHGWRSNYEGRRTFWPSRLSGEEKEAWFLWLDAQLLGLKTHQEKGIKCKLSCCET